MVRLVKNNSQYKITVPVDLVRSKGWAAGTQFRFLEDETGRIFLQALDATQDKRGYALIENNSQYKLTIPVDIVRDKRWTTGTDIRFVEDMQGRVFLREIQGGDRA